MFPVKLRRPGLGLTAEIFPLSRMSGPRKGSLWLDRAGTPAEPDVWPAEGMKAHDDELGVLRSGTLHPLLGVRVEPVRTADGEARLAEEETKTTDFSEFVAAHERGLRQSLSAVLGVEMGREAAAEALAHGWENWEQVRLMDNASGYLYRLGLNWGKRSFGRREINFPEVSTNPSEWFEPGLPDALARLSEKQRVVVYLVHGHDWSLSETAELLEISKGTVQTHMERGMARLRRDLKVET